MSPVKRKKRTRRAVAARRTSEERESVASKLLDKWTSKLKLAIGKVEYYQGVLKRERRNQAKREADDVFDTELKQKDRERSSKNEADKVFGD